MVARRSRPAILAVLVAAMLVTSGTAGVAFAATPAIDDGQQEQTVDGDEVVEQFRETIDSLDTVQFTRTAEVVYDNETTTTTTRTTADIDDSQKRLEIINATSGSNTTTVWNGNNVTTYYPDENRVSEYEVTGTSLLPRLQGLANDSLINYEYNGTETVNGQETYVLEAVRNADTQQPDNTEASATLYIDTETYFPVQVESQVSSEDFAHTSTVTYENVTLGAEIPDETFELDLPDDVDDEPETTMPDVTRHDSYDDLASDTDLTVPEADLPRDFSFDDGAVVHSDEFHSATLSYTNGEESLSVVIRADPVTSFDHSDSDRYEAVEVGDTTGYVYTSDDFLALYVEGDQPYTIYGEIGQETATDIAAAILDG
jgi:outer membrane lipoprotein-sorting protein